MHALNRLSVLRIDCACQIKTTRVQKLCRPLGEHLRFVAHVTLSQTVISLQYKINYEGMSYGVPIIFRFLNPVAFSNTPGPQLMKI